VKGGVVGLRLLHGFGVGRRLVVFGQGPVELAWQGWVPLRRPRSAFYRDPDKAMASQERLNKEIRRRSDVEESSPTGVRSSAWSAPC
jgi:hypothetical protein